MSTTKPAPPLPNRYRTIADLLDKDYNYREAMVWETVTPVVEVFAMPIRDVDPSLDVDGVAMFLVRFKVEATKHKGTSRERTYTATQIPRIGFATRAKAIGYALGKIEDAENKGSEDTGPVERFVGKRRDRERADYAYITWLRDPSEANMKAWLDARAKLPRQPVPRS